MDSSEEDLYSASPSDTPSGSPPSSITASGVTAMDVDDDTQSHKKRAQPPASAQEAATKKRVKQKQSSSQPEAGVIGRSVF